MNSRTKNPLFEKNHQIKMKTLPPIFRLNELGTARRRRLAEKLLRRMRVSRRTAARFASRFIF